MTGPRRLHSTAMVAALGNMAMRHAPIVKHPPGTEVRLHALARVQRAYMDRGMTAEQAAWNARIDEQKAQERAARKATP